VNGGNIWVHRVKSEGDRTKCDGTDSHRPAQVTRCLAGRQEGPKTWGRSRTAEINAKKDKGGSEVANLKLRTRNTRRAKEEIKKNSLIGTPVHTPFVQRQN